MADSGGSSAGLTTTVLPAAKAGAIPQPTSNMGKFQGTMKPQGPHGCRTVHASWPETAKAVRRSMCRARFV